MSHLVLFTVPAFALPRLPLPAPALPPLPAPALPPLPASRFPLPAPAPAVQEHGSGALAESIEGLGQSMRVLMIGAHPDDEDTQIIAWLSRGLHVKTAYLSLTRGDGGQNAIGNELGEALGVIRTEELLAARRVDGGSQYFSRAYDYGFSKSAAEAFTQWPHDSLLRDVLTVVRSFRPHVIISVFTGTPRDGHGQHQAAGILAREAYDWASDTTRFPPSTTGGYGAWTVSKFYRGAGFRRESGTITMNVGEYDPVLGRSYAEVAAISRSQHRSQAFGTLQPKGVRMDALQREAVRVAAPQDPKQERSIFSGIDTTWMRFRSVVAPGARSRLDTLASAVSAVRAAFDVFHPASVVESLVRLDRLAASICAVALPGGSADRSCEEVPGDLGTSLQELRDRAGEALLLATGVAVEATAPRELWATTEPVTVRLAVYNRGTLPVRILGAAVTEGEGKSEPSVAEVDLPPDSAWTLELGAKAGAAFRRVTQPRWLKAPRQGAMLDYRVDGAPEESWAIDARARVVLGIGGARVTAQVPVVYRYADPVRGERNDPIAGVPAISVLLDQEFEYAPARTAIAREIRVHLTSAGAGQGAVRVRLVLPEGLRSDSAARTVSGLQAGTVQTVSFTVRGQLSAGRHVVQVIATDSAGHEYTQGYRTIAYEHIRPRRVYQPSQLVLQAVDLVAGGPRRVGYVRGVGDNSMPSLAQLGYDVVPIDPAVLAQSDLRGFDAIVVGPRAYESSSALVANNSRLLEYVRDGGTMVVQYGQYEMQRPGMMPYPITISRPHDRVTDENAPVTLLDSTSGVLRTPNVITQADFEGWVQDRSLYMPRTFDSHYIPSLAMNDPGEPANRGAILVAAYGSGTYVYTTLAFFRQLPNGVPGAARLFANLLAARAPTP